MGIRDPTSPVRVKADRCCDKLFGSNSIYTISPKQCPLLRLLCSDSCVAHSDDQTQRAVHECGFDCHQPERQLSQTLCYTIIASIPYLGSNDRRLDTFIRAAFIARVHMFFLYDFISLPSMQHATLSIICRFAVRAINPLKITGAVRCLTVS